MRQVDAGKEGLVVEMSRRELETLYCCVVEAKEALPEDEFRIRVGVGYAACRVLIDEMRAVLGWSSVEELRLRLEPQFGLDERGPASEHEATPPAPPR